MLLLSAPSDKISSNLRERSTTLQLLHLNMDQFAGDLVHLMVDLRLDQFIEFTDHNTFIIQFDGTDLYDFKRQLLHSILFAGVTLIPFQIQNHIIH